MKAVQALETVDDWMSYANEVNPKRDPLTIDRLRKFPGFENYTDEQATYTIQSLEQLAVIIYECAAQNSIICIDNQQIVSLNSQNNPEKALVNLNTPKPIAA